MSGYVELQCASHFSFLRGVSSAEELFATAAMLGMEALGDHRPELPVRHRARARSGHGPLASA